MLRTVGLNLVPWLPDVVSIIQTYRPWTPRRTSGRIVNKRIWRESEAYRNFGKRFDWSLAIKRHFVTAAPIVETISLVNGGCHELPKSPRITEITKKLTEITTKRTEITGTSCRYTFTEFKNITFITVSNILMISSKKMGKNTKKPEVAILFLLDAELWRVHTRCQSYGLQLFYYAQFFVNFTERNVKKKRLDKFFISGGKNQN